VLLSSAVAGAVLLALSERQLRLILMGGSGLLAFASLILVATGDGERAVGLAVVVAAAIVLASAVKHHHSGIKLTLSDLALTFAGTIPFMLKQYRLAAAATLSGLFALLVAAILILIYGGGANLPWSVRLILAVLAVGLVILVYAGLGGAKTFRPLHTRTPGYLASFAASVLDLASWWRVGSLRMADIDADPLPLLAAMPPTRNIKPDILFIQHESLFNPGLYGLAVEPEIAGVFTPEDGQHGTMKVEIFGGGSWQSEFSILTGLACTSFGPDSYFLFRKGVGKFRHSLATSLATKGYRTQLVSACRRNFLNSDAFYAAIGMTDRHFIDDMALDPDSFEATNSDQIFLGEVERILAADRAGEPRFTLVLTNFNHGPHDRRLVAPGMHEDARAFALSSFNDPHYGEYYARLAETAAAWRHLRTAILASGRPTLVVRYGDHQPTMIRRIEKSLGLAFDDPRQFHTFWAMEGLNLDLPAFARPDPLDIAFLGAIAMSAAGVGLDPVSATRLSLMEDCGSDYFNSRSLKKRRFHRRLVMDGLVVA
jgi:Sulfatase